MKKGRRTLTYLVLATLLARAQVVVDLDITVVPEFPRFMILPIFMLTTLLVALLSRKSARRLASRDSRLLLVCQ
jgi:hypothetical protein